MATSTDVSIGEPVRRYMSTGSTTLVIIEPA